MKVLINVKVDKDLKNCDRRLYKGIKKEFPRVLRFLSVKASLPGEGPLHHLPREVNSLIFLHARICLPSSGHGKSKGPRIVYFVDQKSQEIRVLYVGGHKDDQYNSYSITQEIASRFLSGDFYEWVDD